MKSNVTYVLVHGAWHGGWCWSRVRPLLESAGARVFTPTLTGLGERAHLREPVPSLATHIEDVVRLIEAEELDHIVLAGHSYAGMLLPAVAERVKNRIHRLVYLDAAVPADGDDLASQFPGSTAEDVERRRSAFRSMSKDGKWLPPFPPEVVGVLDPADAAWLNRQLTPHPLRNFLEPVSLKNGGHAGLPKTYVVVTQPPTTQMGYPLHGELAKKSSEWTYREIACGHDLMIIDPAGTAKLLLEAGGLT
ncbi:MULTISPECIES: alpha/beta hydrolase [Bradyrhizobium]|uniref:alpha/beta hydrolase n=1 Tax=Bradyrhizobium TaxID=374 RepID=UPI000488085F|nr:MULTISPECIES: alpha/beta fold hydrolase [Bradyrhizobium]UFW46466.1 alpha/beta fold hydrolase [Bradyrhizobium arachidis]